MKNEEHLILAKAMKLELIENTDTPLVEVSHHIIPLAAYIESAAGEKVIRHRIRELCDELGYDILTRRLSQSRSSGNKNALQLEHRHQSEPIFDETWFTDEEIPEKEQELLLWLHIRKANITHV